MRSKTNKFRLLSFILMGVIFLLATSCSKDDENSSDKTVKDIDDNVYHTVTIGTQLWMVENLKTTRYRNGDSIPNVTGATEWYKLLTGAYCDYDNNPDNSIIYGKLYNWFAVDDSRNIAPTGWHIPTDEEWTILENYVAANLGISGSVAKALASTNYWISYTNAGTIGNDLTTNNSSGFKALPGGYRSHDGTCNFIGKYGYFWSSTEYDTGSAYFRSLYYNSERLIRYSYSRERGYSVRLVRDY